METTEFVQRLRNCDNLAWRELQRKYEKRLAGYVRTRISDRQAVEDVIQETWVAFCTTIDRYDGRGLAAWLVSICHHKVVDALRRQYRQPATVAPEGKPDSRTPEPATVVVREEESAIVERAKHHLRTRLLCSGHWDRLEMWDLIWDREESNAEIARQIGWGDSEAAVSRVSWYRWHWTQQLAELVHEPTRMKPTGKVKRQIEETCESAFSVNATAYQPHGLTVTRGFVGLQESAAEQFAPSCATA